MVAQYGHRIGMNGSAPKCSSEPRFRTGQRRCVADTQTRTSPRESTGWHRATTAQEHQFPFHADPPIRARSRRATLQPAAVAGEQYERNAKVPCRDAGAAIAGLSDAIGRAPPNARTTVARRSGKTASRGGGRTTINRQPATRKKSSLLSEIVHARGPPRQARTCRRKVADANDEPQ
jgi:hypothetical protein